VTGDVAPETARYPPAEMTPAQFEELVAAVLGAVAPYVENLEVKQLEKLSGVDGEYVFDATMRYTLGGMRFLVLVEAKRYTDPVKRDLVQILHSKLQSVGAQKAVMISTAPFQKGAKVYAETHGIALATVTEGRFVYHTRGAGDAPPLSREEAAALGIPDFVAHAYGKGETPGSTTITLLCTDRPDLITEALLGIEPAD
jgi:hypothetical protein